MVGEKWYIIPEAFPLLGAGILVTAVVFGFFGSKAALIPFLFVLFTLYFFRNPERFSQAGPLDVVSPADGVVLSVEEVVEERYLKGKALKISIFLNVFNVHINRAPISGEVEYLSYQPGKFLPAFKGHASHLNERNYLGIRSDHDPRLSLLVVQITGFIARRIVCWVKCGAKLHQGQRFGMIKFGSCTEVYLPQGAVIMVQKGHKVRGGETILGRLQNG